MTVKLHPTDQSNQLRIELQVSNQPQAFLFLSRLAVEIHKNETVLVFAFFLLIPVFISNREILLDDHTKIKEFC